MSSFQKNVVFIAGTVLVLLALCFGTYLTVQNHSQSEALQTQQLAERKEAWKKDNIRSLKDLSGIGALSTEEQTRVDNAGDDLEQLQQVLLDIHQERISFWTNMLEDAVRRRTKLEQSGLLQYAEYNSEIRNAQEGISEDTKKAYNNVASYEAAMEQIHAWRPSDFALYGKQKATAQTSPSFSGTKPSPGVLSVTRNESTTNGAHFQTASLPDNAETPSEKTLQGVDIEVSAALTGWAHAVESNEPADIASYYAQDVDRFFLKLNVNRQYVQDYWEDWFRTHDTRVTSYKLRNITLENETATTAEVRFVEDVVTSANGESSERTTRSRVYLKKEQGAWHISSEQDFKS